MGELSLWAFVVFAFLLSAPCQAPCAEVARETLPNGLHVVVVPNSLAPVATTMVNYLAGADESPEEFPGMAHALEHMMFRGTPGLSASQLANLAAAMGGEFNADTEQTVTRYFFTVPSSDLDLALRIEAIRMKEVLASDSLWKRERGAIEQEVAQDLSDPDYVLRSRVRAELFGGTPYAHDGLGTRESFRKTTAGMLRRFHRAWYKPNNAILVIAGDIDPPRALSRVRELFGAIPARPLPPRRAVNLQPLRPSTLALNTDSPNGTALVAYRLPGFESPEVAAGQVLADVLDSPRGRLYALVPEGKALAAGFDLETFPRGALGAATATFPQGSDGFALATTLKEILAEYAQDGVPPELVEAAKRREVAAAEFRRNSVPGLADAWSQALAVEGRASPDDDVELLRRVTVEDVNRVARQCLVSDTATVGVLTPRRSGKAVASPPAREKESFAPRQTEPTRLPTWAAHLLASPTLPASRVSPSVTVLPNGLRLIVQPEVISGTVTLSGAVKSNPKLQTPPGKEGVARVLDDLFAFGTQALDRLAFQEALDEIAADVSVGTDFSLAVPAEGFERGVALLAENLLSPALPEEGFRVVRQETAAALAGELESPAHLAQRALRSTLYPAGDPTLREATPETVDSLVLDDVRAYHAKVFRPDLATVVVVGRVTAEEAKRVVEKHFGRWEARGPKPETELPPVPANSPSAVAVPDSSRVQVEVTLAEVLGLTRTDRDYYSLQVGNHVLAGAFYATRLYRDLRERTGLVYTVEASLDAGKTRSVYTVSFGCDPSNASRARGVVGRELRTMQQDLVSDEELERVKALLVRQVPLAEASVTDIAEGLLHRALEDLPLDEPVRAARRYLEVTPEEVREAFRRWIRPAGFVQVSLGPKPR